MVSMPNWRRFFGRRDDVLDLDRAAQRYGVRPSSLLGIRDARCALAVDLACAAAGDAWERRMHAGAWAHLPIHAALRALVQYEPPREPLGSAGRDVAKRDADTVNWL